MLLRPRNLRDVRLSARRIKKPSLESRARLLRKRLVQFGVIDRCGRANPSEDRRHTRCQSNGQHHESNCRNCQCDFFLTSPSLSAASAHHYLDDIVTKIRRPVSAIPHGNGRPSLLIKALYVGLAGPPLRGHTSAKTASVGDPAVPLQTSHALVSTRAGDCGEPDRSNITPLYQDQQTQSQRKSCAVE